MSGWFQIKLNAESSSKTEALKRQHRCAFTGHRPEKLSKTAGEVKAALRKEILLAIHDGYSVFITGMARGVDYGK